MQDVEFTVQDGKLFMLQTRSGKRTAEAALKIAVDMVGEGLIDKQHRGGTRRSAGARPDPASDARSQARRSNASRRGLRHRRARQPAKSHSPPKKPRSSPPTIAPSILVRIETSPEDIHGMHAAKGILTARGGMTSHAAVVARGMGRPCVSGAGTIKIDVAKGTMTAGRVDA